ncbi:MAG: hypothetical protein WDO13_06105 [Verrucomicrobiota bacterium]
MSSARSDACEEFACASIEVLACCRMLSWARVVLSVATSTSAMRELAA